MQYPLQLKFKVLAIAHQLTVTDATGALVCYVKQKAFKLKEDVTVFADKEQTQPLYTIKADRVIDWNAKYAFATAAGAPLGMVQRQGTRSLFKAHYDIYDGAEIDMTIHEENPWSKFFDALFGELPVVGVFSGYVFNPKYAVTRTDGTQVMRVIKRPAMLEGKFEIERLADMDEHEEIRAFLSVIMMVLLERMRG
ncbi:MAG TPA: hypothetical protein VHI13_11325 [Candidatus Kapabacteria bacterium]|nr:hypothetical protein [Candidatus Kapabacteria bacterium]